ncbi:hypothetical protein H9P43_007625 [Blastocladiella emersonii ATCC 22665]|nr:hypothetical protein H9P43_007625 [Blastocladiella emersonii ATCC 22665]
MSFHAEVPGWNDPAADIFHTDAASAATDAAQDALHAKLQSVIEAKRATLPQRVFADAEKRLADVLARLHGHQLPAPLASHLAQVLDAHEQVNADETARLLQTLSTSFLDESRWILGLRRLLS